MNAKKIMGAVLVALLAAALFVGAGAAAPGDVDGKTVFYYQELSSDYYGTWNNGANSFTIEAGANFVSNTALPEGKYSYNDSVAIYLKKPTATIAATATISGAKYIVADGGVIYKGSSIATFDAASPIGTVTPALKFLVTLPNGVAKEMSETDLEALVVASDVATGKYTVQVVYNKTAQISGQDVFADGIPAGSLVSDIVFTFNIKGASSVSISADVETVLKGDTVIVTITGKPGLEFKISGDFDVVSPGTVTKNTAGTAYVMPNDGKATLYMQANAAAKNGENKIKVTPLDAQGTEITDDEQSVTITIQKGTITAKADKEAYYIGNDVVLSGTSTAGDLYFYIAGTNKAYAVLNGEDGTNSVTPEDDKTWEFEIDGSTFDFFDAGSYTIYVSAGPATTEAALDTYETVILVLKQPFISITEAPAVAVIGTEYTVTGTAEATGEVMYYVFGTNYFVNGTADVKKGAFELEFDIKDMDAGQYFMVIQHPMYDGNFNIAAVPGDKIVLNETADAQAGLGKVLFTVDKRQTTNAAQALCDALDTQNIDDMYVKLSFIVAAQESVINPIPAEVTKGSKLTVSGSTNVGEGKLVTVEMVSTAFAAQPKDIVGSASFIALTTKTDENGNWEVTFDTTGLNVDEYSVTAAVADLNKATAKVNVIEGAPTQQPTDEPTTAPTETQPTETTPTQTPGFGVLAALAGLGAVAVLLLRRE